MMVEHFVKVCRRSLKVNTDKSRMIGLGGEEGLENGIHVDGAQLNQVSE